MKDISYKMTNVNNINQIRLILGTGLLHKGSISLKWPFDFHFSKLDGWMDAFPKLLSPSELPTGQKAALVRLQSPTKMNDADGEKAKSLSS